MIFRDWQGVLDGHKTQTRRPKLEGEFLVVRDGVKVVLGQSGRGKWRVGGSYAIQPGRGRPSVGRFELVDIREERIQDISEGDVVAEGMRRAYPGGPIWLPASEAVGWFLSAVDAFRALWDSIWKYRPERHWESNPEVWVLVMRV